MNKDDGALVISVNSHDNCSLSLRHASGRVRAVSTTCCFILALIPACRHEMVSKIIQIRAVDLLNRLFPTSRGAILRFAITEASLVSSSISASILGNSSCIDEIGGIGVEYFGLRFVL